MTTNLGIDFKVFLCADGNPSLGMGHIYQMIALLNHLKNSIPKRNILVVTKSGHNIVEILIETGVQIIAVASDNDIYDEILKFQPKTIVIDNLNVSIDLAKKIKLNTNSRLIIMTNLSDANIYADVTVMAGMGSQFRNLRIENESQIQLWGPKYWLLRPEFLKRKFAEVKRDNVPSNSLLIFGGSDQANLSTACLDELKNLKVMKRIGVVLGASFSSYESFNPVHEETLNLKEVKLYKNVSNVAELMESYDLVLASPGLSFFEALLCGIPVLCFHQNEFQKEAWAGLIPTYDINDVCKLHELISNKNFVFPDDEIVTQMEIGEGWEEIVNEILKN